MREQPVEPGSDGGGRPARRVWLAALYDRHAAMMFRQALMILADHAAAQDAVHEVFVKLAKMDVGRIRDEAAYLRRAARHASFRLIGRSRRKPPADRALLAPEPAGCAIREEQRAAIEAALRRLPPVQREVVHLKVYEDLTFRDIAEVLEVSINTAASRYRYALAKLRRLLAAEHDDGLG